MKSKIFITVLLVCGLVCHGQFISSEKMSHATENMILNVKQFGQFVKRFNYVEDFMGNAIEADFAAQFPRNEYIKFLFNLKDSRLDESNPDFQKFNAKANAFIEYVCDGKRLISRNSDKIIVSAECEVKYKNQIESLNLILQQKYRNGGYCWEIVGAPNIGNFKVGNSDSERSFIPPTNNELNFTHLKRVFEDNENFIDYLDDNYQNSSLNILKSFVEQGTIEFHHVKKMTYFIFDIEGWAIRVDEFVRDDVNSGWLIGNIERWDGEPMKYVTK